MGKSKTIEQQLDTNEEFQKYIDSMTVKMDTNVSKISSELDSMIDKHYKSYDDAQPLLEGKYQHLSTVSEWSLASVQKLINACRNSIFGQVTPDGSSKNNISEEVSLAIQGINQRGVLIASAAFNIVQSLLIGFTNETKTDVMYKVDVKPLAPGLTLFIGAANNIYSHAEFFKNETIIQNMFVYKVYFSIKEGEYTSKLSDLEAYETEKQALRKNIEAISSAIVKLDVVSENYLAKLATYTMITEQLNNNLKNISKKIQKLITPAPANLQNTRTLSGDASRDSVLDKCDAMVLKNVNCLNLALQNSKTKREEK